MQDVDTITLIFTSVVLALYNLEVDYNQPAVVQGLMMPDSVCAVIEL